MAYGTVFRPDFSVYARSSLFLLRDIHVELLDHGNTRVGTALSNTARLVPSNVVGVTARPFRHGRVRDVLRLLRLARL
jgi:hypothetical protein